MERRLTTDEVRNMYRNASGEPISQKTLCQWKKLFGMPFIKIGRECYYVESALLDWESKHTYNLRKGR